MPRHTALYDALEVSPDADAATLKRSYRKLAVKYHPDKNNGSEEATAAFQKVSRAYEVLSDPEKRKMYDAHGEEGVNQAEAGGGPMNANDIFASMFGGGGGDPFESFFGGRRGGGRQRPQQVISRVKAAVDLKTLVRGGTIQVQFNEAVAKHLMTGQSCTDFVTCPECGGAGHVTQTRQVGPGMYQQTQGVCGHCEGRGYTLPTDTADDYVWMEEVKSFPLEVPAGASLVKPRVLAGKGQLYVVPEAGTVKRSDLHVVLECTSSEKDEWQLHSPKHRHLQWTPKQHVVFGLVTNRLRCIHPDGKEYLLEMPAEGRTETFVAPGLGLPAEAGSPNSPYADTPRGDLLIKVLWDFDTKTLDKHGWFQEMRKGMHEKAPWTDPIARPGATPCLTAEQYEAHMDERRNAAAGAAGFGGGGGEGRPECVQS